jgi:prepilin-type N-terminal cleavage/methylation domain-containing protein/prepilin-type processing-associated H-X9-DG protein
MNRSPSLHKGFTLIELLVVIAIIAILAAILFPVFAQARQKAQQTQCLSNMRQVSVAIGMYAQDWDGVLPITMDLLSNDQTTVLHSWFTELSPYITSNQIYWCPSDPDRSDPSMWGSFEMNGMLTDGARPISAAAQPSATILMAERAPHWATLPGNNPANQASDYYDYCLDTWLPDGNWPAGICGNPYLPHADGTAGWSTRLDPQRHTGGSNYAFLDGHVKWMQWTQTYTSQSDNMWDLQ